MMSETRNCQNCKQEFRIEPEDFLFYEKMQVPAPTFCPECRFQRRLMFRNDRTLYRRVCDLCGKNTMSMFAPGKPFKVYCQPCWWGDKWDAEEYAMDYDPTRNFFEQFRELQRKVPLMSLINDYSLLVNSEYVNHAGRLKNCYLIFNSDQNENVLYATQSNSVKDSADSYMLGESELCYGAINCRKSFNVIFSEDCEDCHDVYFSKNCTGCSNCFGCVNLRGKSYYIFNEPYSKEEYEKKIKEFDFGSAKFLEEIRQKAYRFWMRFPAKFMHGTHNVNVSGDYIYESRNALYMYQVQDLEEGKFAQWITEKPAKDVYDYTEWGNGAERIYDAITTGGGSYMVKFVYGSWSHVRNVEYSIYTHTSSNIFGCVGIRNKEFCILNKQYTKEEFETLRVKIIRDLDERPYIDGKGRIWKYGEFFPYDLSFFDYNESSAMQYFPRSRDEVIKEGWRWHEQEKSEYQITKESRDLPDHINDTDDAILQEVIGCGLCGRAYRVIPAEFALLRRFGVPAPRNCPDCRHRERLVRINPPVLWPRVCAKCGGEILSSFAPDRSEILYCDACYQEEIV